MGVIPTVNTIPSVQKPPATLRSRPASSNNRIDAKPRSSSWIKGYSMTNSTSNIGNGDVDSDTYRVVKFFFNFFNSQKKNVYFLIRGFNLYKDFILVYD